LPLLCTVCAKPLKRGPEGVPGFGPLLRCQSWCAKLVCKVGAQSWCTKLVHKVGAQSWCTKLVHKVGAQSWCAKLVHRFGPPLLGSKTGDHFWTGFERSRPPLENSGVVLSNPTGESSCFATIVHGVCQTAQKGSRRGPRFWTPFLEVVRNRYPEKWCTTFWGALKSGGAKVGAPILGTTKSCGAKVGAPILGTTKSWCPKRRTHF